MSAVLAQTLREAAYVASAEAANLLESVGAEPPTGRRELRAWAEVHEKAAREAAEAAAYARLLLKQTRPTSAPAKAKPRFT